MTIAPDLSFALQAIGIVLDRTDEPWWIIASAAVALHGADPGSVADVDVLLGLGDAGRILPTLGIALRPGSAHPSFRSSMFGSWDGTALPVEFMANFHHRSGTGWRPVRPATRQAITVDGIDVFVPERFELQALLTEFGRPKDLERARRLAALPDAPPALS